MTRKMLSTIFSAWSKELLLTLFISKTTMKSKGETTYSGLRFFQEERKGNSKSRDRLTVLVPPTSSMSLVKLETALVCWESTSLRTSLGPRRLLIKSQRWRKRCSRITTRLELTTWKTSLEIPNMSGLKRLKSLEKKHSCSLPAAVRDLGTLRRECILCLLCSVCLGSPASSSWKTRSLPTSRSTRLSKNDSAHRFHI